MGSTDSWLSDGFAKRQECTDSLSLAEELLIVL